LTTKVAIVVLLFFSKAAIMELLYTSNLFQNSILESEADAHMAAHFETAYLKQIVSEEKKNC